MLIKYDYFFGMLILFIFITLRSNQVYSQTFGFGCLGLSGIYGGYSVQQFNALGLNESLKQYYSENGFPDLDPNFREAQGIRVGANIFRIKYENYFITLKGFYQELESEKTFSRDVVEGEFKDIYLLKLNHWSVGLDFGVSLGKFIDWKFAEGGLMFYSSKFTSRILQNGQLLSESKYESPKTNIGFYVGSGMILNIIPDYISIEGTVIYSFIKIESLKSTNNDVIPSAALNKNFIESGRIGAVVQLNLGFPL